MRKAVAEILPHQLNFGPRSARAAATTGKEILEGIGQLKAGAIRNIHGRKRRKEVPLTDGVSRMESGKGALEQLAQKRYRPPTHPLMQRFGGEVDRRGQLRPFGCQLR